MVGAVLGFWYAALGYRFLRETLMTTGFILGAGVTYPIAFDLLYQVTACMLYM